MKQMKKWYPIERWELLEYTIINESSITMEIKYLESELIKFGELKIKYLAENCFEGAAACRDKEVDLRDKIIQLKNSYGK